ncbi:MAG: hypothetical protein ABIK62_02075, partial [candidate division WOR-3 bacterium]
MDFDSAGSCVIAWADTRNGDLDVFAQRVLPNGGLVNPNFRVVDDYDMWWQGEPAVGLQSSGRFLVVWEDRRHGGSDVLAQFYQADGTPVDTNYQINDNTGYSDQRGAAITVLPDNRFVVAWEDWRDDWGDIYAQILSADGSPIGPNFRVTDPPDWQQYGACIASDSQGNFTIAWMDARSGWDIYAQRYDATGQPLGANFRVNDDADPHTFQWGPSISMSPQGAIAIAWEDSRDDSLHPRIYAQCFSPTGQRLGHNFMVSDTCPGTDQLSPSITHNDQGGFLVVWTDYRIGSANIYAQAFDADGQRIGSNFLVNDDPVQSNHGNPAARYSPRLEYWVIWDKAGADNPGIYARRYTHDLVPLGTSFRVADDTFASIQRISSVVACNSRIMTIWEDERSGATDIYCQLSDSLGNPIGPNLKMNDDELGPHHFYSTAALDFMGNAITAWTDARDGYNIYAQALDRQGNRIGANYRVNDNPNPAMHWSPCAARDSAGNSVIVFADARDTTSGYRIFGQLYDRDCQPINGNFTIGEPGASQLYPSVAMAPNGSFLVAWMDDRNQGSIYAQLCRSDGTPVGPNFRVNDDPPGAYHGYPCVAAAPDNGFAVAWEDARNSDDWDIYCQRYTPDLE